ncbi:MAG: hypothetical protein HC835_19390 [Oscillatoriales cyanobacterium RM2_1_1]|nr:hypothetical protein [Oscillatoriales cyanobacterium SM2_3_0]NJO47589.1 hypothetical protein [Oscillatoriales cyanobacterium RM2_1_1]
MAEEFLSLETNDDAPQAAIKPEPRQQVKHLLIGSPDTVHCTIQNLHVRGYAEAQAWSPPVKAGNLGQPGDVLSVLYKFGIGFSLA